MNGLLMKDSVDKVVSEKFANITDFAELELIRKAIEAGIEFVYDNPDDFDLIDKDDAFDYVGENPPDPPDRD